MLRQVSIFSFALLAIATTSCTKSEDDVRKAQRETAGLMPDNDPKFEAEYVADQSQVKLVAARNVSYEPLDTFRGKSKSKSEGDEPASEDTPEKSTAGASPKTAHATGAAAPQLPPGGSFWSRVGMKAVMGGGAPPPSPRTAPPAKPSSKDDEPTAKDQKAAEDDEASADEEESNEDEVDEEESADEDSGDEESKDSDSDGN